MSNKLKCARVTVVAGATVEVAKSSGMRCCKAMEAGSQSKAKDCNPACMRKVCSHLGPSLFSAGHKPSLNGSKAKLRAHAGKRNNFPARAKLLRCWWQARR